MTSILINSFVLGGAIVAPGTITLGTPDGNGIPYTMPSLPSGAGSLIIQGSLDNSTWFDCITGLAGGATGNFNVSPVDGGSPLGHQSELTYLRAKNTNGGAVGTSTNATTVALPAAPGAPTDPVWGTGGCDPDVYTLGATTPATMPARGVTFNGWTSSVDPPGDATGTGWGVEQAFETGCAYGPESPGYAACTAVNIYGESALGTVLDCGTSPP